MHSETIKKLRYYKNTFLFLEIFITSLRIAFRSFVGDVQAGIVSLPAIDRKPFAGYSREKIERYTNVYALLLSKVGLRSTCLKHSILLCHMLRRHGFDAKINFGSRKKDKKQEGISTEGHCWVTMGQEKKEMPYEIILTYP